MRAPSYEYVLLHQFEVVFRDGEHKTQRATRDYQKVWENVIDNPPEEGVTPVLVYRMNGETCAVVAGMDELIGNEECAMEILRLSAAATAREKEQEIATIRARVAELEAQLERTRLPLWILREEVPMEEIRRCAKECLNTWPEEGIADDARVINRWLAGLGK